MIFLRRCPARFAFVLSSRFRRWLLQPELVVSSLRLSGSSRVLDLGAGSGVVAEVLLGRLPRVSVYLLDAQRQMIARARRRLTPRGPSRAAFVAGLAEFLPFPPASFDAVLMVTVLGEVDDVGATLREVHRVLRPDGLLSITEHLPDPDFRSASAVRALLEEAGFVERDARGSRWSYTLNATRGHERAT